MESLIFWAAIGFVGYIIYWSVRNDNAKSIKDQRGFIRMRAPDEPDDKGTPGGAPGAG